MNPESSFVSLTGACRCGHVRFRVERPPIITHCCHCRLCQKTSGAPFRVNAMIETDHVTVLQGAPEPYQGEASHKALRCPACHGVLWSHHPALGEAIAFVGVGTLDEGERLAPEAHYFTRSKHPWVVLPPGVRAFEALGDPQKPGAAERIRAALARAGESHRAQGYTHAS